MLFASMASTVARYRTARDDCARDVPEAANMAAARCHTCLRLKGRADIGRLPQK
jgi:hypothetical protein